jgi:S-adenosylmethionine:tRNA ribosyltransferase-isomerase
VLEFFGELPIPPYLNRATQDSDKQTYQTVYSKIKGSVAAPTAGLHFTESVLSRLKQKKVDLGEVTLHVGAGTFKPVKNEMIVDHDMHTEHIVLSKRFLSQLIAHNGKAVAVGTTSVRTLESLYFVGCQLAENPNLSKQDLCISQWEPYEKEYSLSVFDALSIVEDFMFRNSLEFLHISTQIMIVPGYQFRVVEKLITNFHQPKSTLLLLVSAFLKGDWMKCYDYALQNNFRFLSYGDSSILMI